MIHDGVIRSGGVTTAARWFVAVVTVGCWALAGVIYFGRQR